MGLGPPVCETCWVVGCMTNRDDPGWGISHWHCPICGNAELNGSLFTCKVSEDELEANYRFLRFMKGPQPGDLDEPGTD